ncbi:MAG: hypothetical protein QM487_06455 [Candidatus Marithrix sp.]
MNTDFYVLLIFDNRYLFISQDEVQSVEIVADLQPNQDNKNEIGKFVGHGLEAPIYCLDSDLSIMKKMPSNREYFVLLKTEKDQHLMGIVCDEVENINMKQEHLYPQTIPTIMQTKNSPIRELLFYQDNMSCICDGIALVKYINAQK